jgi:beta-glucosidase
MKMKKHLDVTLTAQERAEALVDLMTLEERALVLNYRSPEISRLNIPEYNWWNEGLHGVARAGTATMFPQAIALAAMFDKDLMQTVGEVIALETRAKYNSYSAQGDRDIYKGLTLWSPNINMFRDPRWGRGHETYGEDPYLTAELGIGFVKGIQGDGKVMTAAACVKHYAVHSGPEGGRHTFDAIATKKELEEYYLPHFKALVEAGVEGVMGAYNRLNGEGTCASPFLMKKLEEWGFDGYFVSDYRALEDFYKNHQLTGSDIETAAMGVEAGCHICAGYVYEHIMEAHKQELLTDAAIRSAAIASMRTRIRLGQFDEECELNKVPLEVVSCPEHKQISLETAHKSMVLLQNNGILPLDSSKYQTIGVIGPNANSRKAMQANYFGTADRYHTFLEGIQDAFDGRVLYSLGSHLFKDSTTSLGLYKNDRIAEAVAVAQASEIVILCVGLDADLEGEEGDAGNQFASGDKVDLRLPKSQRLLVEKVLEVGKPTIVVIASGSSLNVEAHQADAIIQAWYPGSEGGIALADILFGNVSPSGKLPITFYESCDLLPDFTNYSLKNRTYRYVKNNVLYPFGYGLTYGHVVVEDVTFNNKVATVTVLNIGSIATEEVVQLYMKDNKSVHAVRNHKLCGFQRLHLTGGERKTLDIAIDKTAFDVVDEEGHRFIDSDSFTLYAGTCQPDELSQKLSGTTPVSVEIHL